MKCRRITKIDYSEKASIESKPHPMKFTYPLKYSWLAIFLTYLVSAATLTYTLSLHLRERPSTDLFPPPERAECKGRRFCEQYEWPEDTIDTATFGVFIAALALTGLSFLLLVPRALGVSVGCLTSEKTTGTKVWSVFFYLLYVLGKLVTFMALALFVSFDKMTVRFVMTNWEIVTSCSLLGALGMDSLLSSLLLMEFFGGFEIDYHFLASNYQKFADSKAKKTVTWKSEESGKPSQPSESSFPLEPLLDKTVQN
jgi:hypothetical protein